MQAASPKMPELYIKAGVYIGTDENFAALLHDTPYLLVDFCLLYTWHTYQKQLNLTQTSPSAATANSLRLVSC